MKRSVVAALVIAVAAIGIIVWLATRPDPRHPDAAVGPTSEQPSTLAEEKARARLAVRVFDAEGEPVAGAAVVAGSVGGETNEDGALSLRLAPGDVEIEASKDGYVNEGPLAASTRVHLAGDTDIDVSLTLREPGRLSGTVTADGGPVAARLSLLYADQDFAVDGAGRSDARGEFVLEEVAPGRIRILVETDAKYANTTSREIGLSDGESVEGIEIDLSTGGALAGKVFDADGEAIPNAEIFATGETMARSRRVETTETGGFRIESFPAGSARLRARAPGFTEAVVEDVAVTAGEVAVVEITLQEGSGLWGRVTTPDGDAPETAFVVLLGSQNTDEAVVRTTDDGTYRLDVEPPSGSRLLAVSPYWRSSERVDAVPGSNVDLALRPGGQIRGRVVAADGDPVTDFELGAESFEVDGPVPYQFRAVRTEAFVSSDGTFEFGPVRPGRYWLRAAAHGHAPGTAGPIDVRSGATVDDVVIRLTSGGAVVGKVTDEEGEPIERAQVLVFDPLSPFRTGRTRTAADGTYELRGVPPGRRSIRVIRKGYLTAVSSGLAVPAAGEVTRDVVLARKKPGEKFSFHGIGAVLAAEDGVINVRETMDEKPAVVFGLEAGDRIVAVDGESTRDMRLGNVVERIRGEEGVPVELEIEREGEGRLTIEVERGRVVVR